MVIVQVEQRLWSYMKSQDFCKHVNTLHRNTTSFMEHVNQLHEVFNEEHFQISLRSNLKVFPCL